MACPTCEHTMHKLGLQDHRPTFWCPRCGTLKTLDEVDDIGVPSLVLRCRSMETDIVNGEAKRLSQWNVSGIAESINLPKDRPQ